MEKEIEEIIKKNLPAQVGDVLKARLEQAGLDAVKVKQLEGTLLHRNSEITNLNKTIEEYRKLDERNSKLDAREKGIEERERKQDVWEANLKVTEMEKRITDNTNFVGMVFKSPIFRKTTSESISGSSYWDHVNNKNIFSPDGGGKTKVEEKTKD